MANYMSLYVINKDQGNSYLKLRILQKLLNKISPDNLDNILFKLSGYFKELMVDVYGNYFSQKLFQCCSSEQRIFIFKNVNISY